MAKKKDKLRSDLNRQKKKNSPGIHFIERLKKKLTIFVNIWKTCTVPLFASNSRIVSTHFCEKSDNINMGASNVFFFLILSVFKLYDFWDRPQLTKWASFFFPAKKANNLVLFTLIRGQNMPPPNFIILINFFFNSSIFSPAGLTTVSSNQPQRENKYE